MEIELINADGITLKTKGKYCSEDIDITPKLQTKTTTVNGKVMPDENYVGLKEVTVNVQTAPTLQSKTVTPTKSQQNISPDSGYDGLSGVTVNAIPDNYVIPSGAVNITTNGTHNVSGKATANVNVPSKEEEAKTVDLNMASGNQTITPTSGKVLSQVVVKKPATLIAGNIKKDVNIGGVTGTLEPQTAPKLQTKTVTPTKLQQSVSPDSGYDGLSDVTVNAIPDNYVIPTGTVNITTNGTHDVSGKASVVVAVPSSQPTLNAPTIAINDKILTITNPASNGNFVTKFKVFSNGTALTEAVIKGSTTTVDLSTLLTTTGTYSITAKASAANFNDSAASSAVSYKVAATGYNVTVTSTNYGVSIYDGTSSSGALLGTIEDQDNTPKTVICTSGNLYLTSNYGNYTGANTVVSGGVSIVSEGSYPYDGKFSVIGDGTITVDPMCLIEGTQITLADGSTKAIEDITYGDELLVWNFYDRKFDKAKPSWIKVAEVAPRYNLVKFSNGSEVGFVGAGGEKGYHRIFNKEAGAFTYTGNFKETPNGTTTFAQDGTFPTVVSQEVVEKEVKFYNVITDKHYNLFANGILTSCKLSNKYHIENMRYIGEKLISEEEEKVIWEEKNKLRK